MTSRTVSLPSRVAAAIVAHARREQPRECCGLLLGTASAIVDAVAARNLAEQPTRYVIDPADHFAAIRAARARGIDVVGAYHSHPVTPPHPSPTDLAAAFSEFLFVIVSLADAATPVVRAWELTDGNFAPVSLVRTA